ncbi:hypothetical protein UFOVP251_51 [uncultured Caudovirales phage]|uniref:Uncharacterized protein n=1 Tax=uncultured Caudovirales phage TaxID=2100421 RepID=A0A6J5LIN1_9CAUD|nr:hypothetical protein UFOVP251_51 [uncultured Caudovirales phage]
MITVTSKYGSYSVVGQVLVNTYGVTTTKYGVVSYGAQ